MNKMSRFGMHKDDPEGVRYYDDYVIVDNKGISPLTQSPREYHSTKDGGAEEISILQRRMELYEKDHSRQGRSDYGGGNTSMPLKMTDPEEDEVLAKPKISA
mmetsp:Transcript_2363/g.3575  ORF Transcript_2363/g.3575 Transcript_2363/m.3575 type:complete len:102 (+) Transcript_2363:1578-1883(+)